MHYIFYKQNGYGYIFSVICPPTIWGSWKKPFKVSGKYEFWKFLKVPKIDIHGVLQRKNT